MDLVNDRIPQRILQCVDRRNGHRRRPSLGPISNVVCYWGEDLQESIPDVTPRSNLLLFFSSLRGLGLQTCLPFRRDLSTTNP
ncbi:hypothetical protein MA16_Dca008096 [Dendrobium catenatum]|uniref:Uncharacterized protein n=1 Tax=Dendrobium catenatum TaxID=906689 RepID=A0A2I0WD18_9ASPA|nr:hypothetical protein MA16_Dca008096 [Dendrobium catenatum]